jgi:GTPase SAR1 family protein
MANVVDVIIGTISNFVRTIAQTVEGIQDFFLVRVSGLSFIVLGSRQVGKTTLIEWLRRNMDTIEGFDPDPTAAGGDVVGDFPSNLDGQSMKLKANRDVGGEYSMWETDWVDLFREAEPRGIIFMVDHTDSAVQKDALNFVMQLIEDEPHAARNLKAFFVLVNKQDLWGEATTLEEIEARYRNEKRRLSNLSERIGFKWAMAGGSLMTGRGVRPFIKQFFNTIRPQRQKLIQ